MQFLINLLSSGPPILVGPLVVLGAFILFYRTRDAPAALLVIGSSAFVLLHVFDFTDVWLLGQEALHGGHGPVWRWEHHWSWMAVRITLQLIILCFPVGFLWSALRSTRRI